MAEDVSQSFAMPLRATLNASGPIAKLRAHTVLLRASTVVAVVPATVFDQVVYVAGRGLGQILPADSYLGACVGEA